MVVLRDAQEGRADDWNRSMIRRAKPEDRPDLLKIAAGSGLFERSELGPLEEVIDGHFGDRLGAGHDWLVAGDDGLVGAAYFGPEPMAQGVWNL